MKLKLPSEPTRAYIYNVLLALVPILVTYGIIAAASVPLWLGLAGAVLGLGLARVHVSSQRESK